MNSDLPLERLSVTSSRPNSEYQEKQSSVSRFIPKDKWYKFTIAWSFFQFLVIGILEGCIVKIHTAYVQDLSSLPSGSSNSVGNAKALIVYQIIFILAQCFQLYLCIDAITSLSIIQIVATAAFNWAIFGYSIMQFNQAKNVTSGIDLPPGLVAHPTATIEIVVIGFMSIFAVVWAYLAYKLYNLFGWKLYKEMGADVSIMKSLKLYHIYMMLLKLDAFFFLGFDIQFSVLVLVANRGNNEAFIHMLLIIPCTIAVLATSYFSVRKENMNLTIVALIGLLIATAFLFERLANVMTETSTKYLNSKNSITFFISLTIVLCAMTFVALVLNSRRYGKGLKEKLNH
jgi:hypothetical protein